MVLKTEADVVYVDHTDAEALRRQYALNPDMDVDDIVEVDAVWGDKSLADCVGQAKFDYVIASHVVEHVPDLITWFQEVFDILRPGGELRTVWPDCRFSFDVLRRETELVDVLTNYLLGARRPTVANVLDFRLHYAPDMDGHARFEGRFRPETLQPRHPFELAMDSARWARDQPDRYFDVHCWVFQPRSFASVMARLAAEGLVKFACQRLLDPTMPALEFFAFLTPCEDPIEAAESWRSAAAAASDPLPGSAEEKLQDAGGERLAKLEQELLETRRALEIVRKSTSWRITAPIRHIVSRLRS